VTDSEVGGALEAVEGFSVIPDGDEDGIDRLRVGSALGVVEVVLLPSLVGDENGDGVDCLSVGSALGVVEGILLPLLAVSPVCSAVLLSCKVLLEALRSDEGGNVGKELKIGGKSPVSVVLFFICSKLSVVSELLCSETGGICGYATDPLLPASELFD